MEFETRILLIERDGAYAEVVSRLLMETTNGRAEFEHVALLDDAVELIETARHDLIMLDVSSHSEGALPQVERLLQLAPHAHLVVLATECEEDVAIQAVKRGAQDFLLKSEISFRHLSRAVRFAMERGRNLARLSDRAVHDDLTGLDRRASFREKFRVAVAAAQRRDRKVGLIMIDLNGFKAINDTLGHAAGDRVLIEVASRLRGLIRRSDTVGRFGGDEFIILATDIRDHEDLQQIVGKVHEALAPPVLVDGRSVTLTAAVGGIMADIGRFDAFDELVAEADDRMYRNKRAMIEKRTPAETG
ncbi:MAG: diguanylate cyclase [Geminicoccaceae bacterium]